MKPLVENIEQYLSWTCGRCGRKLTIGKATLDYLGSRFTVDLPRCEPCDFTLIPEDLALGKMLEVEQMLEDK